MDKRHALLAALLLAIPRVALACPVCFGQSDSPLAKGVNWGIFMMLGVVGAVLVAFASFFIYLVRRARLVEGGAEHGAAGLAAPQQGAAQC